MVKRPGYLGIETPLHRNGHNFDLSSKSEVVVDTGYLLSCHTGSAAAGKPGLSHDRR
jgi:hypothetical protein